MMVKKQAYKSPLSPLCVCVHMCCMLQVVQLYWAFYILGGSLITEGGTLLMAVHAIRKGAQQQQMSFSEYGECGRQIDR